MKIKYVGVKLDGETAFASESGIALWLAGEVHEIKDAVGAKMLKHPDVFALDVAQSTKAAEPDAAIDPASADLLVMTRDELKERAKSLGLDVHHNAGIPTLVRAIQVAEATKAAE